jgi:hypothetical protein
MGKYILSMIDIKRLQETGDQLNIFYDNNKDLGVMVPKAKKVGVRIMAEGREGYVRLISKIAELNNDSLSKLDDQSELATALDYDASLESMRQNLMRMLEFISETQWGNSADIMVLADRYNASLQIARMGNRTLDSAMGEVDDWNARYNSPKNPPPPDDTKDIPTLPPNVTGGTKSPNDTNDDNPTQIPK